MAAMDHVPDASAVPTTLPRLTRTPVRTPGPGSTGHRGGHWQRGPHGNKPWLLWGKETNPTTFVHASTLAHSVFVLSLELCIAAACSLCHGIHMTLAVHSNGLLHRCLCVHPVRLFISGLA